MLTHQTTPDIIASHGHFDVLAGPQLVEWPDHSVVGLYHVQVAGCLHAYLRAVKHTNLHWAIVDLRKLCAEIELDLSQLPSTDTQAVVMYSLRAEYDHAFAMVMDSVRYCEEVWTAGQEHAPLSRLTRSARALELHA